MSRAGPCIFRYQAKCLKRRICQFYNNMSQTCIYYVKKCLGALSKLKKNDFEDNSLKIMNFGLFHFRTNLVAQSERGRDRSNFFVFEPILMKFCSELLRASKMSPIEFELAFSIFGQRPYRWRCWG